MPEREMTDPRLYYHVPDVGYIGQPEYEEMPDWDGFLDGVGFSSYVNHPRFAHQSHHIVVAIEKATARRGLEELCNQYGADLLIFGGQFSLTRVNDAVERAKSEDKPVLLMYISDLDCGGWIMPSAFFKRINEIYPREDNAMVQVALTREQAEEYDLPPAFDPESKGYSEAQKQRFYHETGGRACIELDALPEDILLNLLEEKLREYANLDEDGIEYKELVDEYREKAHYLNAELDISNVEERYKRIADDYNAIIDELHGFFDEMNDRVASIDDKRGEIVEEVENRLLEMISGEMRHG
jgi:hypothetical protein